MQARVPAGSPKGGQFGKGGGSYNKVGKSLLKAASGAGPNAEVSVLTDLNGKELTPRTMGLEETVDTPSHPKLLDPTADLVHHHTHPFDTPFSQADVLSTANRVGIKKAVVHTTKASYEMEILQHDRVWREGRDVFSEVHIKEVDRVLDGGKRLSRQDRARKMSTESLNRLQDLGMLNWRKM